MHNWFECKVRYEKTGEDGLPKKVTEHYLIDALSFTEAEKRIIEEVKPFVSGEFTVSTVKRSRIAELFANSSGDKWYRAKVNFISLDEEKGLEKRITTTMYQQANKLDEALDLLMASLGNTLSDWEVVEIKETAIMDVYPYVAPKSPEGDLESEREEAE
ncbi:MAG: DUF4494 domain-containing protein [Bacteroidota bacterium]|nr:DUF4494 domain-containing protein [Bacteroidota bacterium]